MFCKEKHLGRSLHWTDFLFQLNQFYTTYLTSDVNLKLPVVLKLSISLPNILTLHKEYEVTSTPLLLRLPVSKLLSTAVCFFNEVLRRSLLPFIRVKLNSRKTRVWDRQRMMNFQGKKEKLTYKSKTLDSLCTKSGLLLSVLCCVALVHTEIKVKEHDRQISYSVKLYSQVETELQELRQNNARWKITKANQQEVRRAKGEISFDMSTEFLRFELHYKYWNVDCLCL